MRIGRCLIFKSGGVASIWEAEDLFPKTYGDPEKNGPLPDGVCRRVTPNGVYIRATHFMNTAKKPLIGLLAPGITASALAQGTPQIQVLCKLSAMAAMGASNRALA